jgi:hypothetical protein
MQLIFVTTFAALSSLAFGFPSDNQYGGCSGSRDKCYNAVGLLAVDETVKDIILTPIRSFRALVIT